MYYSVHNSEEAVDNATTRARIENGVPGTDTSNGPSPPAATASIFSNDKQQLPPTTPSLDIPMPSDEVLIPKVKRVHSLSTVQEAMEDSSDTSEEEGTPGFGKKPHRFLAISILVSIHSYTSHKRIILVCDT